ncbi:MAG TPA: methyltransferase domain-containing protein [Bacteroidota bacterium]|nr:methyltransferase domain-containing protein [Bacteroidota bacterium]
MSERKFDPGLPELIEDPNADEGLLRDELQSIRTVNRFFGGERAIRLGIGGFLERAGDRVITILDLGTGSADIPLYLSRLARKRKRRIHITAVDKHQLVLNEARRLTEHVPEITIEAGDILNLDYPPASFDIVLCSLTMHHFSSADGVRIMRSMRELSRIGLVIVDLTRGPMAVCVAWLYTALTTRNPMTRTDAVLSVRRGFTVREFRRLAEEAGLERFIVRTIPFFRILLVGMHAQ